MVVTTPRVASAVAQNDLDKVSHGYLLNRLFKGLFVGTSWPVASRSAFSAESCNLMHHTYMMPCRRLKQRLKACGWPLVVESLWDLLFGSGDRLQ